jgi:hypothetical protein
VVVAAVGVNMIRALRGYRALVADAAPWASTIGGKA